MSFGLSGKGGQSKTKESATSEGFKKEFVDIDEEGLQSIINQVLSGPGGLAEIFAGEKTAGIFDSSVGAQASGDLATKLAGELARLTAGTITETKGKTTGKSTTNTREFGGNIGGTIPGFGG